MIYSHDHTVCFPFAMLWPCHEFVNEISWLLRFNPQKQRDYGAKPLLLSIFVISNKWFQGKKTNHSCTSSEIPYSSLLLQLPERPSTPSWTTCSRLSLNLTLDNTVSSPSVFSRYPMDLNYSRLHPPLWTLVCMLPILSKRNSLSLAKYVPLKCLPVASVCVSVRVFKWRCILPLKPCKRLGYIGQKEDHKHKHFIITGLYK